MRRPTPRRGSDVRGRRVLLVSGSPEFPCPHGTFRILSGPCLWPASQFSLPSPTKGNQGRPQPCALPGGERPPAGDQPVDNCGQLVDQPCTGSSCPRGPRVVPGFSPGSVPRPRYVATWGNEGYPHNPQDLLLLLVFS